RPWRQFWLILKEIGFCLREVPETRSLLKAVRLRVESEVFDPSPARPSKLDFPTQEEYRAGQALYKRKKAAWRGLQRERLGGGPPAGEGGGGENPRQRRQELPL